MNTTKKMRFMSVFCAIAIFIPMAAMAQFQWTAGGVEIATSTSSQVWMQAVPDGHAGTFIVYEHSPSGDADIYAQWIDASGTQRWSAGGVAVSSDGGDQKYPSIAADGTGGVIIAWQDEVSNNIYAQRLDANGTLQWGANGIVVCSASGDQTNAQVIADDEGGGIFVWIDKRNGSSSDIYAQKLRSSGFPSWTPNGVPVTTATGNQSGQVILKDGAGGVFVAWKDYRNGFSDIDIYAQRINSEGAQVWTTDGVAVSSADNNQMSPSIAISGSQLIVGWEDSRNGSNDIYAQALDFDGNIQWTADGVGVCTASGTQTHVRLTTDGNDGAILTWSDNRNLYDIYAQRLNDQGSSQWTTDGIVVNESSNLQLSPVISSDNNGGAFIAWKDFRSETSYGLYMQRVQDNGSLVYNADGIEVVASQVNANQGHFAITDESGGTHFVWQDSRDGESDIFAQHANDNITVTAPLQGVLLSGNQSYPVQWTLQTTDTRFDHIVIQLSISPGDGFPTNLSSDAVPTALSYDWTPAGVSTNTASIRLQAKNAAGVIIAEAVGPTFSVDTEPPAAFDLVSPTDVSTVLLEPTFEWQPTTDNLSGFDHYELWLNGAIYVDDLQTTSYSVPVEQPLVAGDYTWTVKAVDVAGMVRQASQTWSFTASLDIDPPLPFNLLAPAHELWTTNDYPEFSWEPTSDARTGLSKYQIFLNDQLRVDNIPPDQTSVDDLQVASGHYHWYVQAVDEVGNIRKSSQTWNLYVDNLPPQAFDLVQPVDGHWSQDSTPTFQWNATADGDSGSGVAKYQLWIDGGLAVDNIGSEITSLTLPGGQALSEGVHTWSVTAFDIMGNTRNSTSEFTVNIDHSVPHPFQLSAPVDQGYATDLSPTFEWMASGDDISSIQKYELWIDGTLNVDGLAINSSPPAQPLSEAVHSWTVKAYDQAGNMTTPSSFNVTVDITPPNAFHLISPEVDEVVHVNRPTFVWRSTTDAVSGFEKFQFFLDGILHTDNLTAQDTSIVLAESFENGSYEWRVRAVDKAGNFIDSEENSPFTIDCRAPEITSSANVQATEDIPFSYTAAATDPDGDQITMTYTNYPSWMTPSGLQISGTPTEGMQDTSFTIEARDGIYTTTQVVNVEVLAVNDAPVVTSSSAATATEDQAFSYTASAFDAEGTEVTFTFHNYPTWLTPQGNQISGTPTEGIVDSSFTVRASDGELNGDLLVNLTVNAVNDPPTVTSPASASATEGEQFRYRATATDIDGPYLSIRFADYPDWLTPSGIEISGVPPNGVQNTSFNVVATDNSLYDTLNVAINVTSINDPPYFEYEFPELSFYDIANLEWPVDLDDYASDPDDPDETLVWTFTRLDTHDVNITIDPQTHEATFQVGQIQGTVITKFTVTDPGNLSATDTLIVHFLITGVEDGPDTVIPDDYQLFDNYPNPFNPTTTIQYGLPHSGPVYLAVYNMMGQEIDVLVDEHRNAGTYKSVWDARDVPSGIYFYQIRMGSYQKVKRMILMK